MIKIVMIYYNFWTKYAPAGLRHKHWHEDDEEHLGENYPVEKAPVAQSPVHVDVNLKTLVEFDVILVKLQDILLLPPSCPAVY